MQILSNPEKRARYDAHLEACSKTGGKQTQTREKGIEIRRNVGVSYRNEDEDIVEWLQWYRNTAMRILCEDPIGTCNDFHDEFKATMQEALRRCYFGPDIGTTLVPNCFEAEERAEVSDSEVLHLVSGHNLFGIVVQKNERPLLKGTSKPIMLDQSHHNRSCQPSLARTSSTISQNTEKVGGNLVKRGISEYNDQSGFVELELYLHGNLVARATRERSRDILSHHGKRNDEISVYLCRDQFAENQGFKSSKTHVDLLLGTIVGLNTTESGDKGKVYSAEGEQTHIIWQFRTPWVW